MPATTRSASSVPPLLSLTRLPSMALAVSSRWKTDAVLLVQRAHEIAHLRTQNALHRSLVRRHHMDFDLAGAQRRRDLEPDEARAQHDHAARRFGALDDGPAVGERAQRVHVRLVGAGIDKRTGSAPVASSSRS